MTHFRLGYTILVGLSFALLTSACSGAESSNPPSTTAGLEIRADGIGNVGVGEPPGTVLAELNSFFGEPDVDSGWIPPDSALYGTCPGLAMRATGWGSLYAFFVSDVAEVGDDNQDTVARLYSFSYGYDFSRNEGATDPRNLGLETSDGVRLGSTRADLRDAFPANLTEEYNEAADTWTWAAQDDLGALRGLFSGPEDDAVVVLIETSQGCEIG